MGEEGEAVSHHLHHNIAHAGIDDFICGDEGHDRLSGDSGDDTIFGGADDDFLREEEGNDRMFGDSGDDLFNSIDRVVDNDFLDGGTGDDRCLSDPDRVVSCSRIER
jgi:Ca2+-binding RTX toxin-like protein